MGQGGGITRKGREQTGEKKKQVGENEAQLLAEGKQQCRAQKWGEGAGRRSGGLVLSMLLLGSVSLPSDVVPPLPTRREGTKLPKADGSYQLSPFMLEAQSRRGLFSSQYVCGARLKFTLLKSRHLPLLEKKKCGLRHGPRGPEETKTAQQLAGALAVTGIKRSSGGLLMPGRNKRNQLLR